MISASDFELVVIDAANVVHHHANDEEGNLIQSIFPERLEAAIESLTDMGWEVKAFLKLGTYWWAVKNKDSETIGDIAIFESLKRQGVLEMVHNEHDDMFWVDYAVQNNGLILTKDKLRTEREAYERDWDDIDARTVRDWEILDSGEFLSPSLPQKDEEERITFKGLKSRLKQLEARVLELESVVEGFQDRASEAKDEVDPASNLAITHQVFRQLLKEDEFVHLTTVYHTLASVHLGLKTSEQNTWRKSWKEELNEILGVSGKMSVWIHEISPFKLELSDDNSNIRRI